MQRCAKIIPLSSGKGFGKCPVVTVGCKWTWTQLVCGASVHFIGFTKRNCDSGTIKELWENKDLIWDSIADGSLSTGKKMWKKMYFDIKLTVSHVVPNTQQILSCYYFPFCLSVKQYIYCAWIQRVFLHHLLFIYLLLTFIHLHIFNYLDSFLADSILMFQYNFNVQKGNRYSLCFTHFILYFLYFFYSFDTTISGDNKIMSCVNLWTSSFANGKKIPFFSFRTRTWTLSRVQFSE